MKSSEVTGLTVSSIRFTINLKSFLKLILVMDKNNLFFDKIYCHNLLIEFKINLKLNQQTKCYRLLRTGESSFNKLTL